MANRLFLFCIGGTGARVLKSLAFLLASGVKLGSGFDTIVPIIVDPDSENGDLNRTKDILRLYTQIRKRVNKPDDFFCHELKSLSDLVDNDTQNSSVFTFKLEETQSSTFNEYIGFDELHENDKNFIRLLFSSKNLQSDLNVGFRGNPNMGSVVLDQFTQSDEFRNFAKVFSKGDSIFIVSSIFGGTGAAGFPLLLKTLRSNFLDLDGIARLNNSKIGSLVMLPYFKVSESENSEIDSNSFEEKAKTALRYYNNTLINQNKLELLYFLGYKGAPTVYENHEGQIRQKNDAHILELIGALSILDYTYQYDDLAPNITKVREYGLLSDTYNVSFVDFDPITNQTLFKQLVKFNLFSAYLNRALPRSIGVTRWTQNSSLHFRKTKLTPEFFNSSEFKNYLGLFSGYFNEWLSELDRNKPSFSPFKNNQEFSNSLDFINNKPIDKRVDVFQKIDESNNRIIDYLDTESEYSQLIKMFGLSTEEVLNKYKLKSI